MSIPKFGVIEEVKGQFDCEVEYQILDEVIRFSVGDSLVFDNPYYRQLFDNDIIELVLSVDCFNAFKEEKICLKEEKFLDYPTKDVGGKFTVSVYFVARKDFELDTDNEYFDEFYNESYSILKGQIVSKVVTRYIDVQTSSSLTSAKLLEVLKNPDQEDAFSVGLLQHSPTLSIKSLDLFWDYKKLRSGAKFKGVKDVMDALLLGPIYIELIRVLIEGRIEGENYEWAESISLALGYSSLEELRKDLEEAEEPDPEESFQIAYNMYATRLFSNDHFTDLFNHLNSL